MQQSVLITGATAGIGLALAWRFGATARLLATGRMPPEEAEPLLPAGTAYAQADQGQPENAVAAIDTALAALDWDRLDLAILNAGTGVARDPALETPSEQRAAIDVNLLSAVALAQTLLPRLERSGGRLVLIGSTARRGAPGFAAYAASKAGLHGFARALAEEWRGRVKVQIIHPGPTRTGMHGKAGHDAGGAARFFAAPGRMAAMIEAAIATGRSPVTLSFARYARSGRWWAS